MDRKLPSEGDLAEGWLLPNGGRLVLVAGLLVSALDRAVHQGGDFSMTAMVILGIVLLIVGLSF
jgi:hypothetical protein